jgi:hypothetical protein
MTLVGRFRVPAIFKAPLPDADTTLMMRGFVTFVVGAAVAIAVFGGGVVGSVPHDRALALYGDDEALASIASILSSARSEMADTANAFVAAAPSATSLPEFNSMRNAAHASINETEALAKALLKGILKDAGTEGAVFDAASAALETLRASRGAQQAVVAAVEYVASDTSTTTTTTTLPNLTTTTTSLPSPTTTATLPGQTTTTTTPPSPTTTTTLPGQTTTTTTLPSVVTPGVGSGGDADTGPGNGVSSAMPPPGPMLEQPPGPMLEQPLGSDGHVTDPQTAPSPTEDLSGWLASILDVALPPTFAAVVLSPLIVIEIVGRIILRSGSSIVPPVFLLGLSLFLFYWRDRRREASATVGEDDLGPNAATA